MKTNQGTISSSDSPAQVNVFIRLSLGLFWTIAACCWSNFIFSKYMGELPTLWEACVEVILCMMAARNFSKESTIRQIRLDGLFIIILAAVFLFGLLLLSAPSLQWSMSIANFLGVLVMILFMVLIANLLIREIILSCFSVGLVVSLLMSTLGVCIYNRLINSIALGNSTLNAESWVLKNHFIAALYSSLALIALILIQGSVKRLIVNKALWIIAKFKERYLQPPLL